MTIKLIILCRILTGIRKRESCSGRGQGPGWGEPQVWPIQAEFIAEPSSSLRTRLGNPVSLVQLTRFQCKVPHSGHKNMKWVPRLTNLVWWNSTSNCHLYSQQKHVPLNKSQNLNCNSQLQNSENYILRKTASRKGTKGETRQKHSINKRCGKSWSERDKKLPCSLGTEAKAKRELETQKSYLNLHRV